VVVLSFEELCLALSHLLGRKGMSGDEVRNIAEYIMNFFGYTDRVIDNILLPTDRDIFYMLEEIGVLTVETFEVDLIPKKGWHIHYWVLRKRRLKEVLNKLKEEGGKKEKEDTSIYGSISNEIWADLHGRGGEK